MASSLIFYCLQLQGRFNGKNVNTVCSAAVVGIGRRPVQQGAILPGRLLVHGSKNN
jgi:hypothetical protein